MIYRETLNEGFTQGELSTMDECLFKWNKRYNERLELEGWYKIALLTGSAWHGFMENIYGSAGENQTVPALELPENAVTSEADHHKILQQQSMLEGMAKAYIKKYTKEIESIRIKFLEKEIAYTHEYRGIPIKIQFKLDLLPEGTRQLFDHKTTAMLRNEILAKWDFKFQFMFYCWGLAKALGLKEVKEFTVNAVRKPQLRPHQREPWIAYRRRVEMDMLAKPDQYFYRSTIDVNKEMLNHFEQEILVPKFERLWMMRQIPESKMWENKNTEACHTFNETCQFFPICAEGASTKGYIRLEKKHTHYDLI